MTQPVLTPPSTLAWMNVLDHIEQCIQQSLSLANEPSLPSPAISSNSPRSLQRLDDRCAAWQACLDQANANADEADTLIRAVEDSFKQWQQSAIVARELLAQWFKLTT